MVSGGAGLRAAAWMGTELLGAGAGPRPELAVSHGGGGGLSAWEGMRPSLQVLRDSHPFHGCILPVRCLWRVVPEAAQEGSHHGLWGRGGRWGGEGRGAVGPGRGENCQWGCVLGTSLWGPLLSPSSPGRLGPSRSLLGGLRGPAPSATLQDPSLEEGGRSWPPGPIRPGRGIHGGDVLPAGPEGRPVLASFPAWTQARPRPGIFLGAEAVLCVCWG